MDVLQEAIYDGAGFPNGLFWLVREQDQIYNSVGRLISDVRKLGIDAHIVRAESFDELLSDLVRYLPATEKLAIKLDDKRKISPRKIDLTRRAQSIPFIRTNAIPIVDYPKTSRLIDCNIGGMREIQEVLKAKGSSLIASRVRKSVLAFGDDSEIKRVFGDHEIKSFDTHGLLAERLHFESGERTILRDALIGALSGYSGFKVIRDRHRRLFRADCVDPKFDLQPLQTATVRTNGVLSDGEISWSEGCGLRLDYQMDQLWLLLTPTILIDIDAETSEVQRQKSKDFVRERRLKRYNNQSNAVLDGWIKAILGSGNDPITLGVDGGTGIGARFEILPITAFSGLAK